MGIKEILQKLTKSKSPIRSEEFKQMERHARMQKILEERMKSPQERELLRHMEEQRQEAIKKKLAEINKQKTHDWWTSNTIQQKYMFKTDLKDQILRQKNIFKVGGKK